MNRLVQIGAITKFASAMKLKKAESDAQLLMYKYDDLQNNGFEAQLAQQQVYPPKQYWVTDPTSFQPAPKWTEPNPLLESPNVTNHDVAPAPRKSLAQMEYPPKQYWVTDPTSFQPAPKWTEPNPLLESPNVTNHDVAPAPRAGLAQMEYPPKQYWVTDPTSFQPAPKWTEPNPLLESPNVTNHDVAPAPRAGLAQVYPPKQYWVTDPTSFQPAPKWTEPNPLLESPNVTNHDVAPAPQAAQPVPNRKALAQTKHHHKHHHHNHQLVHTEADLENMTEDDLLVNLKSTLNSALSSESRGDGDAAVAKTAAIKNIQKALTARILKRLDDGQPLVEVARKMKAIEGMQPQINDMERRLGIMQSVEPVLENAIKTLQKVVDVRGMGKK